MKEFLIGVLASLIGSTLLLLFLGALSDRTRSFLVRILGLLLRIDIDRVYANKEAAKAEVEAELGKAREVAILTSRGNELQRQPFRPIFIDRQQSRPLNVRVLLPNTSPPAGQYDWTAQRERELAVFDPAFGNGLLHHQIDANVAFLRQHVESGPIKLRFFNAPHIGRIVLTENYAFYTPYRSDAHGSDSRVYRFRNGGDMYNNVKRLFEQLWESGGT